jgi:hypothetical protein
MGSGTTLVTANKLNRNCVGFDVNPNYCNMQTGAKMKQWHSNHFLGRQYYEPYDLLPSLYPVNPGEFARERPEQG